MTAAFIEVCENVVAFGWPLLKALGIVLLCVIAITFLGRYTVYALVVTGTLIVMVIGTLIVMVIGTLIPFCAMGIYALVHWSADTLGRWIWYLRYRAWRFKVRRYPVGTPFSPKIPEQWKRRRQYERESKTRRSEGSW